MTCVLPTLECWLSFCRICPEIIQRFFLKDIRMSDYWVILWLVWIHSFKRFYLSHLDHQTANFYIRKLLKIHSTQGTGCLQVHISFTISNIHVENLMNSWSLFELDFLIFFGNSTFFVKKQTTPKVTRFQMNVFCAISLASLSTYYIVGVYIHGYI